MQRPNHDRAAAVLSYCGPYHFALATTEAAHKINDLTQPGTTAFVAGACFTGRLADLKGRPFDLKVRSGDADA